MPDSQFPLTARTKFAIVQQRSLTLFKGAPLSDLRPRAVHPIQTRCRSTLAGVGVFAALAVAGCGGETETAGATSTTIAPVTSVAAAPTSTTGQTTTVVVPTSTTTANVAGGDLRSKTCTDLLPMLEAMRPLGGDAAVQKTVEDTIAWFPQTPEWATLSDSERTATVQGARDAGTGVCH